MSLSVEANPLQRFDASPQLRRFVRLRFLFQSAFRLFDNRGESLFVGHGEVGEDFAIKSNTGRF